MKFFKYILAATVCLALVSPALAGKGKKKKNAPKELSEKQEIDLKHNFFEANREKLLGNLEQAEMHFKKCIEIYPEHASSYYELASIKMQQNRPEESIPLMEKAYELQPKNKWYRQSLAILYESTKRYEKASGVYDLLIEDYPKELYYYENLANMYLYQNELKPALKVYDQIEDKFGINEMASSQKQKIYMSTGNANKAIEEAQKLINNSPGTPKYYTQLAELYSKSGQREKAIETYQKLLEIDSTNAYVQLSMATYYYSGGKKKEGEKLLQKAFANPDLEFEVKARLLFNEIAYKNVASGKVNPIAITLAKTIAEAHPDNAKSFALLGDLTYQSGNKKEALEHYRTSIKKDETQFMIWGQILLIQSEDQQWDSVYESSKTALENFPSQPTLHYFNGLASIQLKKFQEAVDVLELGKDYVIDNNNLLAQFYTNLGDAYHNLNEHENSDKNFESALRLNPNDELVLNNYSYYLSERGENLEKAKEMSKKVVDRHPNSATYLDTYAWILFKNGDYKEAKTWMEKALSNGGDKEGVLLEHYGDILYKVGDTEGALKYWRQAKELGGTTELIDKKIETKQLHE